MFHRTLALASLLAGGCTADATATTAGFQWNNVGASSAKAVAGGGGMVQLSVDTAPDASASESSVNNNVSTSNKTKPRNSKLSLSDLIRCDGRAGRDPCKPPDTINITIGGNTLDPTGNPTGNPNMNPTENPHMSPTGNPTKNPTMKPTTKPTLNPTMSPTKKPTLNPTMSPTRKPTLVPTVSPTRKPTMNPTMRLTPISSSAPTPSPTNNAPITPNGISLCVDDPDWHINHMPELTCTPFIANDPSTLCHLEGEDGTKASESCKYTCDKACRTIRSPTPSPTVSPTNNPTGSPTRIPTTNMPMTAEVTQEPTTKSPTASPINAPTKLSCVDDPEWTVDVNRSFTCEDLAETKNMNLCTVIGVDGATASIACPSKCVDTCRTSVTTSSPSRSPTSAPTPQPVTPLSTHVPSSPTTTGPACTSIAYDTCCSQPRDRLYEDKNQVCALLGCELDQCGKIPTAEPTTEVVITLTTDAPVAGPSTDSPTPSLDDDCETVRISKAGKSGGSAKSGKSGGGSISKAGKSGSGRLQQFQIAKLGKSGGWGVPLLTSSNTKEKCGNADNSKAGKSGGPGVDAFASFKSGKSGGNSGAKTGKSGGSGHSGVTGKAGKSGGDVKKNTYLLFRPKAEKSKSTSVGTDQTSNNYGWSGGGKGEIDNISSAGGAKLSPTNAPTLLTQVPLIPAILPTQTSDHPLLTDDLVETQKSTPVYIHPYANDEYIPHGASRSITQPSHGIFYTEARELFIGTILYVPNEDYCGMDQFTYTVIDSSGQNSATATVSIKVKCTDTSATDPAKVQPVLNDDVVQIEMNGEIYIQVLDNDDYVPPNALGSMTKPTNGTISLDGEKILYLSNTEFCGIDQFSYTVTDVTGQYTDTATVSINVECDPDLVEDNSARPKNSTSAGIDQENGYSPGLEVNDDYAEGIMNEDLAIPILTNDFIPENGGGEPGGGFSKPENGRIVQPTSDGLVYHPNTDFCGYDTFEYEITIGELSDSANVTVHILCDGDAADIPSIQNPSVNNDAVSIARDSDMVIATVLDNDESTGDRLTVVSILYDANHGYCEVHDNGSTVRYTPNSGYHGPDSCVYNACNEGGGCDSGVLSVTVDPAPLGDENGTDTLLISNAKEGGPSQVETSRDPTIYGAVIGVILALTGTWAFVNKRRKGSDGGTPENLDPWFKVASTNDNSEASSLTNESTNKEHLGSSRDIQFGDNNNLSIKTFRTGSPEAHKTRSFSPGELSTPKVVPRSPVNSLFSVSSSRSKKIYAVDDVVDL